MRNNPIPLFHQGYSLIPLRLQKQQLTTEAKAMYGNHNSTVWNTGQCIYCQEDTEKNVESNESLLDGQYIEHIKHNSLVGKIRKWKNVLTTLVFR